MGGYPPIIESEQENCFLRDLIKKNIRIGSTDDGGVGIHIGFERFPGQTVTRLDDAPLSYSNLALKPSWDG